MEIIHLLMLLLLLLGCLFILYTPKSVLKKLKRNVPIDKARKEFRNENKIPLFLIFTFLIFLLFKIIY